MSPDPSAQEWKETQQRTSARELRLCVRLTIVLYGVCVALLATLKFATHRLDALSASEMLYGPPITLASAWVIGLVVAALIKRRPNGKT
jgi:hypothetical protein